MKKIILNPEYKLKKDFGSVILLPKSSFSINDDIDSGSINLIHPIQAYILSCFDGRETEDAIIKASTFFNIDRKIIENFVNKIVDAEEKIVVHFGNIDIVFPAKTLISSEKDPVEKYDFDDFDFEYVDLNFKRNLTPTDITLMLNNKCATDCIYCYADRRIEMDCKISLERIFELIDEAKSFGARGFEVIGGEFFLYKYWDKVTEKLLQNNFHPYISTKIPIGEKIIKKLSELKIQFIQISLDTFNIDNAKEILGVKDNYLNTMQHTFELLENYNIKVLVHTIMNSKNETTEDIDSLFNFLKNYKNIKDWNIDKAGASLYTGRGVYDFQDFKPNPTKMKTIVEHIKKNDFANKCNFTLRYDGINDDESEQQITPVKTNKDWNAFMNRSLCTANYSQMFILPDGKVTICEELYWTEKFIIGDVNENTLLEIWSSDKAKNIFYLKKDEIPEDSPCKTCDSFEECRYRKGICYRDVMKAHGIEKWYYPDRKCPKSIEDKYEIYV